MSHAITRIYATAATAADAVKQLKFEGFTDDDFRLISPPGASIDALMTTLMSRYLLKSDAKIYAGEVMRGRWLITVLTPFGMGARAVEALERHDPIPFSPNAAPPRPERWDEAAPASSALGIPTLWNSAAPESSLGIPTLSTPNWSLSRSLGVPLTSKPSTSRLSPDLAHFSLSGKVGLPLLTKSKGRR